MKICILYRNFFGETGGAGVTTYLRNLRRHIEARGHRVYIISARVREDEKKGYITLLIYLYGHLDPLRDTSLFCFHRF